MAYGSALVDNIQSSTANTPVVFKDGNGTQIGTLCRAWVNFDGTTSPGTIRGSFNVTSVTRNNTGYYTVNFTNALASANYSAVVGATVMGALAGSFICVTPNNASSVNIFTYKNPNDGISYDNSQISVSIFQ